MKICSKYRHILVVTMVVITTNVHIMPITEHKIGMVLHGGTLWAIRKIFP